MESKRTPQSPLSELDSSGALLLNLTIPASDLVLGNKLGQGAYGTVYKAKWRDKDKDVAVKQLLLPNPTEQEKNEFKQEAAVMFQIAADSDHVVRLYKITMQPQLSLVMELMPNGSLYELLQNNRDKPLEWGIRYRLAMDISTGLKDIHSHGVLHRDLKSLNVLLDGNLRAKLTDFGLATTKLTSSRHSSVQGTPHWMAPEVANGEPDSQGSDVYSLGMVLFELAAHRHPYPNLKPLQVLLQVSQGKQETIPTDCPVTFKQLILDCWTVAEKRPKAADVTTRLRPMLDSKETPSTPAAGGVLDSLTSGQLKGSVDYQLGAAPIAPHRSAVLQQTPASLVSIVSPSASQPQPQSPTPSTPPAISQTTSGSRPLEEKAFQTGYALYHQEQYQQALPHLHQAAKAGYAPAYIDLGVMYELGLGVDKEAAEATIWYKKAQRSESWFEQQADTEEAMSQFYFGRYYQFAAGSKKDLLEASGWYRRAAMQGHAEAQYNLGDCYANGIGVSKDLTQAKQWYEKAAAQGSGRAKAQLVALQRPSASPPPPPVVSHPTPSTNTSSSFFSANNPPKPDNKVEAKQAVNNPPQVVPKPIPEKSAAPVVVDEKALGQLLKCVAEGEQDQAEALIKKDSKLLLAAGKVTDLSGRTFENITAFQYALWALDYHMWAMIQRYLPTEAQAEQCQALESKGTEHGKHYDLQPLLEALDTYLSKAHGWNYDQRAVDQWCKKVGSAQKLLPAHVVNEYCRPDRPFSPSPSEWTSPLPRTRAVEVFDGSKCIKGEWFTPPSSVESLGSSFAFWRDSYMVGSVKGDAKSMVASWLQFARGPWGHMQAGRGNDSSSLHALWKARTQQLKLLTDKLVLEFQTTQLVQKVVDVKALGQLLIKFLAEGEQDQAEALIKKNPQLLLTAGKVTDLSGRTFDNITAFQYALWAMDYHMWTMIQKYLPVESQIKQYEELESKGTAHGKHYDLQPLLEALDTYLREAPGWNYDQRAVDQWCKKVGSAQKLLPAHVVNEYCRPDRSFYPLPSEWTSPLPRTRAVEIADGSKCVKGEWFTPLNSIESLGSSFAFWRASAGMPASEKGDSKSRVADWLGFARGPWGGDRRWQNDSSSLRALWDVRIEQLKALADSLSAESQSTMQVGPKK